MGDCLWATPGLRALKKSFPDVKIDLLIRRQWKDLYLGNPNIRKIIFYQPQWYRQLTLLPKLARTHYDKILIFHSNKDIGRIIPYLRYSDIWCHQNLPNIPEDKILKFSKATHPILRRGAIIEKLGAQADGTQMEIFLNKNEHSEASIFLKQNRMEPKEFLYLNIGASLPHKRWPIDKAIALTNIFLKKTSLGIVLGGGPKDAETIQKMKNQLSKKRITHSFHRTLRANCALISQARLMITTDTGPMHIAFANNIPTIAMFGPTRSEDSGPCEIDSKLCKVLQSTALDSKNQVSEKTHEFFKSITVDMVWDKANLLLNQ